MRISISVTEYARPGELDAVAAAADEAGIDTVWVPDHLIQAAPRTAPDDPMLEAMSVLAYLAARTERVRLGTLVAAATFRPAAILVKAVTTLDVLSGGRAWLGLGAGYHEEEAQAFDMPLPPVRERFDALEAALRMAQRMWADELPLPVRPRPVTLPRPPILVGGTGEKRTLRLVAQYADACNVPDIPDGGATVRHKLDVLRRHCEAVGRDYETIEKTISTRIGPGEDPDAFAERLGTLGIDHAIAFASGPWEPGQVAALAPYIRNTP